MCVCVTGHQCVRYLRIMRWWCSNLGQWPLQTYALSLSIASLISIPPALPDSTVFLDCSVPYSILLPPCHQPFIVVALSLFAPAPNLLYWREAPPTSTSPAPATCHPPPFVSAPCTACLILPLFPVFLCPTISTVILCPSPCQPLVGLPVAVPSVSPVPPPRPPWVVLWILAYSGSYFLFGLIFAQVRESRAPPLPVSLLPWTSPLPLLGHSGAV